MLREEIVSVAARTMDSLNGPSIDHEAEIVNVLAAFDHLGWVVCTREPEEDI